MIVLYNVYMLKFTIDIFRGLKEIRKTQEIAIRESIMDYIDNKKLIFFIISF